METGDANMDTQPEVQGPPYQIWIINRRNGIQYGEKPRLIYPKKPKQKKAKKVGR